MLQFNCPHCRGLVRLREELAGRRGTCPHCKKPIQAPAAAAPSEPELYEPEPVIQEVEAPRVQRRAGSSSRKKKTNTLPLLVGGGAAAGVIVIGLVVWLVVRGSGNRPQAAPGLAASSSTASSAPAVATPPATTAAITQPTATPSIAPRANLLAYLPEGLETLAGVEVAEALKSEDKVLATAQIQSTLQPILARVGLGVNQLSEVVIGCGAEVEEMVIAVRTNDSVNGANVRKRLGCAEGAQKLGPLDCYALPHDAESADAVVCFPDARTMVLGSRELLAKSFGSAAGATAPAVLKAVTDTPGAKTHMWLVARTTVLKSQVGQLASFGVAETVLGSSLDKVGKFAMGYDLSRGLQLRAVLECGSEGEAKLVRTAADALRAALRDAEKKLAAEASGSRQGSSQGGSQGAAPGPGGGSGSRGSSGPGDSAGSRQGSPGAGMSSGMPGSQPGGYSPDSSVGAVWNATEVKQNANYVSVMLPPVKVQNAHGASPLDFFGAAAQAGFARSAIGSAFFPGSLRRTSTALRKLEQNDGAIPAGTIVLEKHPRPIQRVSWLAALLPYLGFQELHDQIDFSLPWTDEKNLPVAATVVDAFLDPLVPQRRWKGLPYPGAALTHYVGMGGVGPDAPRLPKEDPNAGIFGYDRRTALADVRDGVGNTIMMIEALDVFGPWVQGGGATVRAAQSQPYIGTTSAFGSPGGAGVMTIFADGSVRFLSKDIDPKVFEALCTINGGETVDLAKNAPPARIRESKGP